MALPPKGDPRRPLHLAARSMRILGFLLILMSVISAAPVYVMARSGPIRGARSMRLALIFGTTVVVYGGVGACYVVFAAFLVRRKFWAVVASLVLAGLHCLVSLVVLLMLAHAALTSGGDVPMIPVLVMLMVVAALAQLVSHLSRSFEAIKHMPADERGFAPIMPAQPIAAASIPPPSSPLPGGPFRDDLNPPPPR